MLGLPMDCQSVRSAVCMVAGWLGEGVRVRGVGDFTGLTKGVDRI